MREEAPRMLRGGSSARLCTEPAGSGREDGSRCAIQDGDGSGSPSRGVVTCASHRKVLVGWGIVRIVTTGDARSDDATGADHCCSVAVLAW